MTRDPRATDGPRVVSVHFRADFEGLCVTLEVYRPSAYGRHTGIVPTSRDVPEDIRAALTEWLAGGAS